MVNASFLVNFNPFRNFWCQEFDVEIFEIGGGHKGG